MSLPTCGSSCSSEVPVVAFDKCNPEINAGQISKIFLANVGNPMSNWASAIEWDSRLDNDGAGASKIRTLIVVADQPAAAKTVKEISLGRKVNGVKQFTVNFKIDETNAANYEALRSLECNSGSFLAWYQTRDGLIFGGNSGIPVSVSMDQVIPESYQDLINFTGQLTWESKFHPERITSPITDALGDQF